MAYLLDGAVILLFVAAVIVGYKKGFLGTALNVVGFLAALVLAFLLSAPIANGVYKAVVQPSCEKAIESALAESAGDLTPAESIEKAMDSMPHFVQGLMERKGVTAQVLTNKIGDRVGSTAHEVAVSVTDTVARPVMTLFARCILFVVLFIVLLIVAGILEKILRKLFRKTLFGGVDGILGAVFGAVRGVLWALVLVTVLQAIAGFTKPDAAVSEKTIDETRVVSVIAEHNPLFSAKNAILEQFRVIF